MEYCWVQDAQPPRALTPTCSLKPTAATSLKFQGKPQRGGSSVWGRVRAWGGRAGLELRGGAKVCRNTGGLGAGADKVWLFCLCQSLGQCINRACMAAAICLAHSLAAPSAFAHRHVSSVRSGPPTLPPSPPPPSPPPPSPPHQICSCCGTASTTVCFQL